MVKMTKDYTQFGIENYILNITGVFNYDKEFLKKAAKSNYDELKFSDDFEKFSKDFFYPDLRNQFFNNDKKRHTILVRENSENSIVDLFSYQYDGKTKSKELQLKILDSRLDLFDEGFGLFTLNLKVQSDKTDLSKFSDAAFLARNFETNIEHTDYEKWHQYIEKEVLLGSSTRGQSVKVDEYSGSKYKLFMVLDIPQLDEKEMMKSLLFDIGTLSRIGSAIGNTYDSMDKDYVQQLIKKNTISVFNNWEGLALLDSFTVVGNKILEAPYKKETYSSVYYGIYLYCLFLKYNLFKYNFEIADLDEDRRSNFQDFLAKYYFNYISYNFLPTEIFNKIKTALDIEKELQLLNEKIVAVGQKIQEEQQDRTNKILGIVTVLTSVSSLQPVYDYLLEGQKILGWSSEIYWVTTFSIVLVLGGGVGFYVFGKTILKWIKKKSK
jgi:hypothetical protein